MTNPHEEFVRRCGGSHVLAKACQDEWMYVAQLDNRTAVQFTFAELREEWVSLRNAKVVGIDLEGLDHFYTGRDIEVRLSQIALVSESES